MSRTSPARKQNRPALKPLETKHRSLTAKPSPVTSSEQMGNQAALRLASSNAGKTNSPTPKVPAPPLANPAPVSAKAPEATADAGKAKEVETTAEKENIEKKQTGKLKTGSAANPPDPTGSDSTKGSPAKKKQATKVEGKKAKGEAEEKAKGKKAKEGAQAAPAKAISAPKPKINNNPATDPNFQAAKSEIVSTTKKEKKLPTGASTSEAAQKAAGSPANESAAFAGRDQTANMSAQKTTGFDKAAFIESMKKQLEAVQAPPKGEEPKPKESLDQISSAVKAESKAQQQNSSGALDGATKTQSSTKHSPRKSVQPPAIPSTPAPNLKKSKMATPTAAPKAGTDFSQEEGAVDSQMRDAEVTEDQMKNGNEPTFSSASKSKSSAKQNTKQASDAYRKKEQETLSQTSQGAETDSTKATSDMHQNRGAGVKQVPKMQSKSTKSNEAKRKEVMGHVEKLCNETKELVEEELDLMDKQVDDLFNEGEKEAMDAFEEKVDDMKDAYRKEEKKGKAFGGFFSGWFIPKEVADKAYVEGKSAYIQSMQGTIDKIANCVEGHMKAATSLIATGKQQVEGYLKGLDTTDIPGIQKEAAKLMQSHFDKLSQSLEDRQQNLLSNLSDKFKNAANDLNEHILDLQGKGRSWWQKAYDAVVSVIKAIIKIKNQLVALLAKAKNAIGAIIKNPIGFLRNLVAAIRLGFNNFVGNIKTHLIAGLITWLTGSLGPVGITIPKKFNFKGVLSIAMQVMGLTWGFLRLKLVKIFGEPAVKIFEGAFKLFQIVRKEGLAGLWKYLQAQMTDFKENLISQIKEAIISQVITAGIKWVLSLFNPVGAFFKACEMVIKIVQFFIQNGARILSVLNSIFDGFIDMAAGRIGGAAKKVEGALAKTIPMIISMLASLLGISGLVGKVQKIIMKLRARISGAIDKVIIKLKKPLNKLLGKAKGKVKGAVKKVKTKVKSVAKKVFSWWKKKTPFKMGKENHNICFKGKGRGAKIVFRSYSRDKGQLIAHIKETYVLKNGDIEHIQAKITAIQNIKTKLGVKPKPAKLHELKKAKQDLATLLTIYCKTPKPNKANSPLTLPRSEVKLRETKTLKYKRTKDGKTVSSEVGVFMKASPLSWKPGNTVGTNANISNSKYPIYNEINHGTGKYAKGHLLNHNLHGPGHDPRNLTPISVRTNIAHHTHVEKHLKHRVNDKMEVYEYAVKVIFGAPRKGRKVDAENYLPQGLTYRYFQLEQDKNRRWVKKSGGKVFTASIMNTLP